MSLEPTPRPVTAGVDDADPDVALVARAQADPREFGPLYERHRRAIADHVFRRIGDRAAADDVVAEVFLAALRGLARYRSLGIPFRFWLLRIAQNAVTRHFRDSARDARRAPLGADYPAEVRETDLDAEWMRNALATLPPHQQTMIALHHLDGFDVAEIAWIVGLPLGTVKSHLKRGRDRLRERFARERIRDPSTAHGGDP